MKAAIVLALAEGITVTGISLTGYWHINTYLQMSFGIGPFDKGKTDLGEMADLDQGMLTEALYTPASAWLHSQSHGAEGKIDRVG